MSDVKAKTNDTLSTPRVAALLARLFSEADASNAKLRQFFGALSPEERAQRMSDPDNYRELYGRAKELYLAVAPAIAKLLYVLARSSGARAIIEFGTSFGISTIHLAAALRDNVGGRLIGTELEPSKVAVVATSRCPSLPTWSSRSRCESGA